MAAAMARVTTKAKTRATDNSLLVLVFHGSIFVDVPSQSESQKCKSQRQLIQFQYIAKSSHRRNNRTRLPTTRRSPKRFPPLAPPRSVLLWMRSLLVDTFAIFYSKILVEFWYPRYLEPRPVARVMLAIVVWKPWNPYWNLPRDRGFLLERLDRLLPTTSTLHLTPYGPSPRQFQW